MGPTTTGRFHATFNEEPSTTIGRDYTLLDAAGAGKVVGVSYTEEGDSANLFTTFMDLALPGADAAPWTAREFSSRHFGTAEHRPELRSRLIIHRLESRPPHYCVVNAARVLDVVPRRNNVFQALAVFFVAAFRLNSGLLGLLNLRSSSVGLTEFELQ